jgi:radial spoke head protein 4A
VEGVKEGEEEEGENVDPKKEKRGEGVNTYAYWVADNVLEEWIQIPDLAPNELEASRKIKVLFTGNLERDIITNPFFFGKEKHYLIAQIARISHGTTVTPHRLFRFVEETNGISKILKL